jgi:hypothetical protein
MKRYRDYEIEKAKELRKKEGYSFAQLQRITGIPATTIRNWCADDIRGTKWDTLLITNQRKRQELKLSEINELDSLKKIDTVNAKLFISLLYWCEGTKYPASNKIEFVNSDPHLIHLFTNLLREAFPLDESKFRIHVQIHDVQNFTEIKNFWSQLLKIPISQFTKPTITKIKGGKHRKEYFGTCAIRYNDYRILLKIIGIYEEFSKRFRESADKTRKIK